LLYFIIKDEFSEKLFPISLYLYVFIYEYT
jgi:hypothetical protein